MTLWKRCYLAITRRKVKSSLLCIIFYVMSVLIALSMVISSAQVVTQGKISERSGMTIRLQLNKDDTNERISKIPKKHIQSGDIDGYMDGGKNQDYSILQKDIDQLLKVNGLGGYTITTASKPVTVDNIKRYETKNQRKSAKNTKEKAIRLQGTRSMKFHDDVLQEKIKLIDGRWIEEKDKDSIVMNQKLAELNHLKVGDKIILGTLVEGVYYDEPIKHKAFTVKIVGIYQNISLETNQDSQHSADRMIENRIYGNLQLPTKITQNEKDPVEFETVNFSVKNANEYNDVIKRMYKVNINWGRYDLIDQNGTRTNIGSSIYGLQKIGNFIFMLVLGVGAIIITLLLLLWTKSRSYEASIFISLGNTKKTILAQFMIEIMSLFTIAFMVMCISMPFISKIAGEVIVEQQVEKTQQDVTKEYNINPNIGVPKIQEVKIQVQPVTIFIVFGSGVLISLCSICISAYPILRKPPKEILSETSS